MISDPLGTTCSHHGLEVEIPIPLPTGTTLIVAPNGSIPRKRGARPNSNRHFSPPPRNALPSLNSSMLVGNRHGSKLRSSMTNPTTQPASGLICNIGLIVVVGASSTLIKISLNGPGLFNTCTDGPFPV